MVRQVALVPAGCQPWNADVVSSQGDKFAYAATLAIYIYEVDPRYKEHRLLSIMSEHKRTITSICWCPDNPDLLASASLDGNIYVWDVAKEATLASYVYKDAVHCLGWCQNKRQCLGLMNKQGPLWLWYIHDPIGSLSYVKDSNFSSTVTMFRWHHMKLSTVAFGHEDGTVSVIDIDFKKMTGSKTQKHMFKPESSTDGEDQADPVTALEWDPLSKDYLLLCNQIGGVRMVDVFTTRLIMNFQMPSAASAVQSLSWIINAPGMFVTGDVKGGILRVWSVSNPTPIENVKIKNLGFHRLEVINSQTGRTSQSGEKSSSSSPEHVSSTSEAKSPAITTQAHFTVPHAQIVCAFTDGSIGLYDLGRKKWIFLREEGHVETIFDCKFHPENPDQLATASFDGTIKIWDITSMKCLMSSPGNEGIVYHISWAPADLDCIAACTAKQGAFIWDVKKNKIIKRLSGHAPQANVFCISWNHADPKRVATCGSDGYCIVQQVDGTLIQKYRHPMSVFGGDWSPFNKDMLATGCEDKLIRIFYLTSSSDQPIRTFKGHEGKVFHVKWNPLKEGILCSGSDDGMIRVWDYARDQCVSVLVGHTAPVRGLTWNSEIGTLLASGSWDFNIRIWDTRDGACLYRIQDHGADVYGLTSHPARPFLLASCSRDSTVRLWSITSLVQPIELSLLAGKPPGEQVGAGEPVMTGAAPQTLSGRVSKDLYHELAQKKDEQVSLLIGFSKFFAHPCGTTNLWDLVSVLRGHDVMTLSPSYSSGIVHRKHITKFQMSEAQQYELTRMSKFGGGIGAPPKEECMRKAANVHIKLGNVQRYCELMVELGKWERALALAPSVSLKYWQHLNRRYCEALKAVDSDDFVPFSVASGDVVDVVSFFCARGQLNDAQVVAQSASEGSMPLPHTMRTKPPPDQVISQDEYDKVTVDLMEKLAHFHFHKGSPVLAACCHLAMDDQKRAMSKLIRGHELELALCLGRVLGGAPNETDLVLELLSRRCEHLGKWELGLDLLKLQADPSMQQAKLCARCSSSMAEINSLHHKAGIPSMEACEMRAKSLLSTPTAIMDCVKCFLLSPVSEKGLEIGLQFVTEQMEVGGWTVDDVYPMLQLLGCIKTEKLQQAFCSGMKFKLLMLSAYMGALVAIKRHYYPVVQPLFAHARELLLKGAVRVSVTPGQIEEETNLFRAFREKRMSADAKSRYSVLLHRCGLDNGWVVEPGRDAVASSHLPSHSDVHKSVLTGERIKGQYFFLEDGQSVMSLNEALMWAKVNPFSPLASGMRINPF